MDNIILGGAIADMAPEKREEIEQFIQQDFLPRHPVTGEVLPRKNRLGEPQPLVVHVVIFN